MHHGCYSGALLWKHTGSVTSLNATTQPARVRVRDTYADPGVFECVGGRHSLGWVNGQHLIDQVFGLGGHRVPLWGGKLFNDIVKTIWSLANRYC